jgi:glycoside hydrolase-like protein
VLKPSSSAHTKLIGLLAGLLVLQFGTMTPSARATSNHSSPAEPATSYLGFDQNIYPGEEALVMLRKTFSFAGYWISPPPEETTNTWQGKREILRKLDFGFLVLYRGRESKGLKSGVDAAAKGKSDASDAAANARREGFQPNTIIFLDIEEGGRLGETYHAYLRAWADALKSAGYRPGVYCSAIAVKEGKGVSITTADDIRANEAPREFSYWVYNDVCPPAPGCAPRLAASPPNKSGIPYAAVWQFAQSPRRKEYTSKCATTYAKDGNCYAPEDTAHKWFLDINSANSADPSAGAK